MTIVSLKRGIRNTPSLRLAIYVALAALAALSAMGYLIAEGAHAENRWMLAALCGAAAVSERWSVRVASAQLSGYVLPTAVAAVLFGPLAAGIVGIAAMLGDSELIRRTRETRMTILRWILYASVSCLTGIAAGLAADLAHHVITSPIGATVVAALIATTTIETLDSLAGVMTARVLGRSATEAASRLVPVAITSVLLYGPGAALLALAYLHLSAWTAPLLLVPGLALQRVYTLYQRQRALTEEIKESNLRLTKTNAILEKVNFSFAAALVQTLEESDRYTAGHSRAVATYARDIGVQMGLDHDIVERLHLCGLVHDIGKIGLSPSLLNKEGRLTLEERREMERHSEIGERILRKVDAYSEIALIVRHHHERVDGKGYPDRLTEEHIPLESRIIAVADAYNAMTSDRPYRKAMSYEIARDRLLQAMGSQFSTAPVVAFLAVLADASDLYRAARGDEFGANQSANSSFGGFGTSSLVRGAA
jgi:hypothetical protein